MPLSEFAVTPFAALARDAERVGVHLDAATLALCERYADLLIERNTTMNLTAITAPADIATKHFLDSFTGVAVRTWSGRERIIDVEWDVEEPGKRPVRIARAEPAPVGSSRTFSSASSLTGSVDRLTRVRWNAPGRQS